MNARETGSRMRDTRDTKEEDRRTSEELKGKEVRSTRDTKGEVRRTSEKRGGDEKGSQIQESYKIKTEKRTKSGHTMYAESSSPFRLRLGMVVILR